MTQHKDQRVGVFVDVQNMYYSAKQLYSSKVNYANILKTAIADRKFIRAIAYVIKADVGDEGDFFEALEKIGYEVKAKDLQVFFGGAKKGDWDVGIAMDIMRLASKLDVIVLVSGDGDFRDLMHHVKSLGCRAEVIAFGKTASSMLKSEADKFTDMDKEKSYLIPDKRSKHAVTKRAELRKPVELHPNKKVDSKPRFNGDSTRFNGDSRNFTRVPRSNFRSGMRARGPRDFDPRRKVEEEISFMQRINMDQPGEPQVVKPAVKEVPVKPVPKQTEQETPAVKAKKKPSTKRKKAAPKTEGPAKPPVLGEEIKTEPKEAKKKDKGLLGKLLG